jgi:protein KRI1
MDDYEREYNFRFEEAEGESLKTYPRDVTSVRKKDDKRKRQRQARKERKLEEKRRKAEEIKRLKNLKEKEIAERLAKIQGLPRACGAAP